MEEPTEGASLVSGPDGKRRRVSYFYEPTIGDYYYGQGHLMKPHRIRMAHNLIVHYGLHRRMEVNRPFPTMCHLPTLYIGMEYMRTHSFKLAEQFFMQAKTICPSDPLVYNELGVVTYHVKEYNKAVWWFEKTLAHIPSSLSEMWEPTVVNLAHAYRKLKMYHEAISCYERALMLSNRSLSTYAGLAYTYHLQDNFSAAITYYHKALWLKPDDQFCTEMLSLAFVDEGRHGIDPKIEFQ